MGDENDTLMEDGGHTPPPADTFDLADYGEIEKIPSDPHNIGAPPESKGAPPTGKILSAKVDRDAIKKKQEQKAQDEPGENDEEEEVDGDEEDLEESEEKDTAETDEEDQTGTGDDGTPTPPGPKPKRDYTKFDQADLPVLKKLPNHIFKLMAPHFEKLKAEREAAKTTAEAYNKLKTSPGALPDAYYAHPEAYKLSPDYNNVVRGYHRAEGEAQHWQEQLAAIDAGAEKILNIRGYDKRGQPVYEEVAADGLKYNVINAMNQAQIAASKYADMATNLQRGFANSYQGIVQNITSVSDQEFGKLLPELQPIKEDIDNFRKLMPAQVHNMPLFDTMSKMWSVIIRQGKMIEKQKAAGAQKKATDKELKLRGPRPTLTSGLKTGKSNGVPEVVDFEKLHSEYNS